MSGNWDLILLKVAFRGFNPQNSLNNTILLIIVLAIIGIIFLSNLVYRNRAGKKTVRKKYNRFVGRKTAVNIGLEPHHINLMESLVKKLKIPHPVLLYSNRNMLDTFLKNSIYFIEKQVDKTADEKAQYIKYIYEIKEKIEMHSKKSIGLQSSHFIKPEQDFMIMNQQGEKFRAKVVNNLSSAIVCGYPSSGHYKADAIKRGMRIKVFFWRENDAGYSFMSRIAGFDAKSENSHFYIRHSNKLTKEQQRKFYRRPVKATCFLYPVEITGKKNKRKSVNILYDIKFMGVMQDISARGCRITVRHSFEMDQLLKIDFSINRKENISAIGRIRNVNIISGQGYSLSLAFKRISNRARNDIYAYIFNYIP